MSQTPKGHLDRQRLQPLLAQLTRVYTRHTDTDRQTRRLRYVRLR